MNRPRRLKAGGSGYSFFVKAAKLALPVVALVIIGIIAARLSSDPIQQQIAEIPPAEKTAPGETELISAKYEGQDEKGQQYTLSATRAYRENEGAQVILLDRPKGDITLTDGSWVAVEAEKGQYDMQGGALRLDGRVTLYHDAGYSFALDSLNVDITARSATSTSTIEGTGPAGTIRAKGLIVQQGGTRLVFGGPATLTLRLNKKEGKG